jgi:hypothetical protein
VADNVEIVRRLTVAMKGFWGGAGSWEETLGRFYDPDVDYYPARKWPDNQPRHGTNELAAFMEAYNEAWETADWQLLDIHEVGDDRVLARMRLSGAGRGSGLEMTGDVYLCFWFRRGRIFRQEDHLTEAGARGGLGIED